MPIGTFSPKPVNFKASGPGGNNPESEALRSTIIAMMTAASNGSARNLQKAIGPSEYGHPCPRQVAMKVAQVEENPSYLDPFPSIMGVAMHTWMESILPRDEWIPEQRVHVDGRGLWGHSDAYHIPTRTVVDWKFLGRTTHQQWLGGYVNSTYEVQADSYGLGFVNAGYPVDRVAVAVFCRAKTLQDLFVWSKPWDRSNAERAMARLELLKTYVTATGASNENRAPLLAVPAVSGDGCHFCPFGGAAADGRCDRKLA